MSNEEERNDLQRSYRATGWLLLFVVGLLLTIYVCSGIYCVSQNELGVVQRFGHMRAHAVQPGIHYAFPWPIDTVRKVPVREMLRTSVSLFSEKSEDARLFKQWAGLASYCITGDNNVLNISFVIQYTVSDPAQYLFTAEDPGRILQDVARAALIHVIAALPVDDILTFGKKAIEDRVREEINRRLADVNCGIGISFVELNEVSPPTQVQASFDDVVNANIDKERLVNEAEAYRNSVLLEARGNAQRLMEQAAAYRARVMTEADGDAKRFRMQSEAYSEAPDDTRIRLWQDFIAEVFPELEEMVIVDVQHGKPVGQLRLTVPQTWQ